MNSGADPPLVSIIIPTLNGARRLGSTLAALGRQSFPPEATEIIVVDDGSTDATAPVVASALNGRARYCHQPHRGATPARNLGAEQARGAILVFVDDDVELLSDSLAALAAALQQPGPRVVVGTLHAEGAATPPPAADDGDRDVPFTECLSGLLAVRASDFESLGRFQDPTGGWPNWDDVYFGYRAHRSGYRIVRSGRAQAIHHDASAVSVASLARRSQRASESAVRLFRQYPEIEAHLPMFRDKAPIRRGDPAALIARKLLRRAASTRIVVSALERLEGVLQRAAPRPYLLRPLQRWIVGAHMFRGYREGLREKP